MLLGQIKIANDPVALNPTDFAHANQLQHDYNDNSWLLSHSTLPASILSALVFGAIAHHGMKANGPGDKIDKNELEGWGKEYLKTPHVVAIPEKGTDNASYQTVQHRGNDYHVIKYDPELSKSVGAHEIGHGMGGFPRPDMHIPFANIIGSSLLATGAFNSGEAIANHGSLFDTWKQAPALLGGLALTAPTLIDEYMASSNAKKILKDKGIKPRGLTRAWATYAAPTGLAAVLGAGGYFLGKHYNDKLHEINPDLSFHAH